jgi:hypothetical protein
MKRNYLLALTSVIVLTFSNCEKPHHDDCENENNSCMHTVEYWRTHPNEWKQDVFGWGKATYTKEQALVTLYTPAKDNYLLAVFQQLIALHLNIANGIVCEDVGWAYTGTQDYLYLHTKEGQRLPPFGDAYDNSEDAKDLAGDLQAMNEGEVPTSCCTERETGK